MTEYIGREEKCGDCIHVEVCERNPILTEFSRENPAYCKKNYESCRYLPGAAWKMDGDENNG